jgi:hypothetical protein
LDPYPSLVDQVVYIYKRILWEEREYGQPGDQSRITGWKEVLKRLATDPRMKRVWTELYRKQRGSNEFLNPVKRIFQRGNPELIELRPFRAPGDLAILHDPEHQNIAVRHFLEVAWFFATTSPPLMTKDKFNSLTKPHRAMASRLRKDAEDLRALCLGDRAADLESAAMSCEKLADDLTDVGLQMKWLFPIVSRSRGDDVMRNYVLRVSAHCREAFGKSLSSTVATTASVALSKNVSGDQVREIVRAHDPGVI